MKRFFIPLILTLFAVNLVADDLYKNPGKLKHLWHSSRNFFQRDNAKNAELQQLNPAWKIEKIWPADGVHNISASTCDDHGNIYFLSGNSFFCIGDPKRK